MDGRSSVKKQSESSGACSRGRASGDRRVGKHLVEKLAADDTCWRAADRSKAAVACSAGLGEIEFTTRNYLVADGLIYADGARRHKWTYADGQGQAVGVEKPSA